MAFLDVKKLKETAGNAVSKAKNVADEVSKKAQETANSQEISNKLLKIKATTDQTVQRASEKVSDMKIYKTITKNENIQNAIHRMGCLANVAIDVSSDAIRFVGEKSRDVIADEQTQKILSATSDMARKTGKITVKGLKVISGVQAVQDRKKSIINKEEADKLKEEIEAANEAIRDDLNETLEDFGSYRIEVLHKTVGVFLKYLERMNQRSKAKEYDFLMAIDIKQEELSELKKIDMKASEAAQVLATGGGFAAIGLIGTPILVQSAVTAFAAASTGTAISTLSGAAASNAVLAWLGGGSIAAGGTGIAGGQIVLGALTAGATVGLAVVAVGTLASAFYAKKNTESEQYLAEIREWASQTEQSWIAINAIKSRILEMKSVTEQLEKKANLLLSQMEPFVDIFDQKDQEHLKIFQQTAMVIKSMSELAQTPILDPEGNINKEANIIIDKTEKVLNRDL